LALGVYPTTSLKEAREKRDTAKKQIDGGIDPNENKKAVKQSKAESAANSFEVIAREWYERNMPDKSESHKKRSMRLMTMDLFPHIGVKPITDKPNGNTSALTPKSGGAWSLKPQPRILCRYQPKPLPSCKNLNP